VQPPTELVLGAPLHIREREDETVVGIRTADSEWQELKRFPTETDDQ